MPQFARVSDTQLVNLNSIALAEWRKPADPAHRYLLLTLAGTVGPVQTDAGGWSHESREVAVQEPLATPLWRLLEGASAPPPAAEPRSANSGTNGHGNGHLYDRHTNGHAPDRDRDRRDERPPARNGDDGGYEPPRNSRLRPPAVPRTGKQLFGWAKDEGIKDELVAFGKKHGFPWRLNDWNDAEVADGYAEGLEILNVSRRRN